MPPESLRLITRTSSGVDVNVLGIQFKAPDPAGHRQHEPNTTLISIAGRGTASGCVPVPVPCLVLPCLALPVLGIVMTCIFLTRAYYYTLIILYSNSYCTATAHLHQIQLHAASCGRSHGPGQRSRASATFELCARADPPEPFSRILSCSAESQQLRRTGYCH